MQPERLPRLTRHANGMRRWQFSLRRMLVAVWLAGVAACLLSDVPRLSWPPAQVLAYFLSAATAGAGLGALVKRSLCGALIGIVLAGPSIPPLAIAWRFLLPRLGA